jgi:hypothetical protein
MPSHIAPFWTSPALIATEARAGANRVAAPLVLNLLAVSILLPDTVGFLVQGLWFSVARVILLALTPVVLMRFGRMLAAGRYRFVLSDLFVLSTSLWMFVAFGMTDGVEAALNHAGPQALDFCLAYMATRVLLSEHGQAVAFINFLCWSIAIVALLGLLDTLTHSDFVQHVTWTWFGGKKFEDMGGERLGLLRATSTIEHPIIYGVTCSFGLLLAAFVPIRGRKVAIFACGLGTILSLASAPIQGAFLGFALLFYNRIVAGIPYRWGALVAMATVGIVTVFTVVENPLGYVFRHLIFDTESGYYRMWIWQSSIEALTQSPWFGLGFTFSKFYEIPHSVDSVWLWTALQFGIPGSLLLALSVIGAASLPTSGPRARLTVAESKLGTILGILIFLIVFLGFTVDYFGNVADLIPLLAGVRAHLGELGRVSANAQVPRRPLRVQPVSGSREVLL